MPKQLWLPGGKGGGGRRAILSSSVEIKEIGGVWMITPTPKFISDCKDQGRSEVTRQVAGLSDLYARNNRSVFILEESNAVYPNRLRDEIPRAPTLQEDIPERNLTAFWQTAFVFALFVVIIGAILISGVLK